MGTPNLRTFPAHQRRKPVRSVLSDDLARVEVIHDLADEEEIQDCGCQLKRMDEETSEQLEVYPRRAFVTRPIRPKYSSMGRRQKLLRYLPMSFPKPSQQPPCQRVCSQANTQVDALLAIGKTVQTLRTTFRKPTVRQGTIRVAKKRLLTLDLLEKKVRSRPLIQLNEIKGGGLG